MASGTQSARVASKEGASSSSRSRHPNLAEDVGRRISTSAPVTCAADIFTTPRSPAAADKLQEMVGCVKLEASGAMHGTCGEFFPEDAEGASVNSTREGRLGSLGAMPLQSRRLLLPRTMDVKGAAVSGFTGQPMSSPSSTSYANQVDNYLYGGSSASSSSCGAPFQPLPSSTATTSARGKDKRKEEQMVQMGLVAAEDPQALDHRLDAIASTPTPDDDPCGVQCQGQLMLPMWMKAKHLPPAVSTPKAQGRDGNKLSSSTFLMEEATLWDGPLCGWENDCLRFLHGRFDERERDARSEEKASRGPTWSIGACAEDLPLSLQQITVEVPRAPPCPANGPHLLDLAMDPARRTECPLCAEQWNRAQALAKQGKNVETEAKDAPKVHERVGGQRMHSVKCTYAWLGLSLMVTLRNLRFDPDTGEPMTEWRPLEDVLPPPIADVTQYWRQHRRALARAETGKTA
eukprot:gnl/MRDRNA2_/MRDRNA2_100685_c0_seq1.p1 gnl/MRDRNA2_/MRDRNA2_100685_c0~~gnl/MRDRNA2_/MRDRNA2_100685_c0_seq1.p1  ORF type:complete len:461 (-),score=67.74 gnl/MRDRNA2_/MRDRNA2_100685_c0_seq1:210-1592(-)